MHDVSLEVRDKDKLLKLIVAYYGLKSESDVTESQIKSFVGDKLREALTNLKDK